MKSIFFAFMCVLMLNSCKKETSYKSFGNEIIPDGAIAATTMAEQYIAMAAGDTITTKMIGKVDEVCQAKGCWMKVDLGTGEQVMVKFKDYGFFMPKNIAGKEVIMNGIAFVEEVSVNEQRHYAEDGGATEAELEAITQPKKTLSFLADGVLLKED